MALVYYRVSKGRAVHEKKDCPNLKRGNRKPWTHSAEVVESCGWAYCSTCAGGR